MPAPPTVEFIQQDIGDIPVRYLREFDFIWASPPCQKHTAMKTMHNARYHDCHIDPLREKLEASNVPYAIENVPLAPLRNPVLLCWTMFGDSGDMDPGTLEMYHLERHRHIEASFNFYAPECGCCHRWNCLGIYGGHVRDRRRRPGSKSRGIADPPVALAHRLMGINWMTLKELSEAIPPVYSQWTSQIWMEGL